MPRTSCFLFTLLLAASALNTACEGEPARGICEENDCPCVGAGCAGNAANVWGLAIDELHLGGLTNADGFRVEQVLRADGAAFALAVERGRFFGLTGRDQSYELSTGDSILVEHVPTSAFYELRILDTLDVASSIPGDEPVTAYRLGYPASLSADFVDICGHRPSSDPAFSGLETMAFVLEGERYDADTKTVRATGVDARGWINLACAGTALAKMKLMRYDPGLSAEHPRFTTPEQRQATLKMITADYCGTGRSFTVDGQNIAWNNAAGWLTTNTDLPSEAIWNENGAICLDTPRLILDMPGLMEEIEAECKTAGLRLPPPCADLANADEWARFAEWRTYLY